MRSWKQQSWTGNTGTTSIPTTTETVVATLGGISTQSADAVVLLEGYLQIASGAATTALTVNIRRGSLTGAIVAVSEVDVALASSNYGVGVQVNDAPGEVASQVYVLTVTQTAATGNGSVTYASLSATS
jgi:type IV pilus biogenesis protein CpaD/CtpE